MEKNNGMLTSAIIIWVCLAISIIFLLFNYFEYGYAVELKHIILIFAVAGCGAFFTWSAKNSKKAENIQISTTVSDEELSV